MSSPEGSAGVAGEVAFLSPNLLNSCSFQESLELRLLREGNGVAS